MPAERADQFYSRLSESIQLIFDLTSRIDERLKLLIEQHHEAEEKIDKVSTGLNDCMTRVTLLENRGGGGTAAEMDSLRKKLDELDRLTRSMELKMAGVEIHTNIHVNRWQLLTDGLFKLAMTLLAGYALYLLVGKT